MLVLLWIVLPMLAAIYIASDRAARTLRREVEQNQKLKAQSLAETVSLWDNMNVTVLRNLSQHPDILSMEVGRQLPNLIRLNHAHRAYLYTISTYNREGEAIATSNNQRLDNLETGDNAIASWREGYWFQNALAGNDMTRQTAVSKNPGEAIAIFSAPIRDLPDLKWGNQGTLVTELQQLLKKLGYYNDEIDGLYGPLTTEAVFQFQTSYPGLWASGVADPVTRQLLGLVTQLQQHQPTLYPRDGSGQIKGVVAIGAFLMPLDRTLETIFVGEKGLAAIVDERGQVLVDSRSDADASTKLKDWSSYPPVKALLEGKSGVFPFADKNGVKWLSYSIRLDNGWSVIIQQKRAEALQQEELIWKLAITIAISAILGVGAVTYVLASRLIQPITDLTVAATTLSSGDLEQRVQIHRRDEIGMLALAFNWMASQLQTSFATLRETNVELEKHIEQLQETQTQLIQSEKMSSLGLLVAGVAHEINNPVSFIHGNIAHLTGYSRDLLELLQYYQEQYPSPPQHIVDLSKQIELEFLQDDMVKVLSSMKMGTERIREIVQSLRTFSRVDESDKKKVDIHPGIESTLLILTSRLKSKPGYPEISVTKDYGKLPEVECYPGMLNQVLMNIIANAIDALEEHYVLVAGDGKLEPPSIQIRTEVMKPPFPRQFRIFGPHAAIRISDNGPGIPPKTLSRLFDPFFTTKPVGKGTGLGLSISYKIIVERHGGELYCNSSLGKGTEFVIAIPI